MQFEDSDFAITEDTLFHEYMIDKYRDILSDNICFKRGTIGGALSLRIVNLYDLKNITKEYLDKLYGIKEIVANNNGYLNLINIAEHLNSILVTIEHNKNEYENSSNDTYTFYLVDMLTSIVNAYLEFNKTGLSIDDFVTDIEELLPLLESRLDKSNITHMYNMVIDIFNYNYKYVNGILDIYKNEVKVQGESKLKTLAYIYPTSLFAAAKFMIGSKILDCSGEINSVQNTKEFETLNAIYDRSKLFRRYGFIEITFRTDNIKGYDVVTVYKLNDNTFIVSK